jgi:uncharacterized UBP type Zn finger protein
MGDTCAHLEKLERQGRQPVKPSGHGCKECLETGDQWMELRLCMSCGHVGCCDSSPNKHATAHFHKTKHPVIRAFEPDAAWAWCYVDEVTADEVPALPGEVPSRHYAAPGASHP